MRAHAVGVALVCFVVAALVISGEAAGLSMAMTGLVLGAVAIIGHR